jgi:hypothetical protein
MLLCEAQSEKMRKVEMECNVGQVVNMRGHEEGALIIEAAPIPLLPPPK